jgi:hypothetical protein
VDLKISPSEPRVAGSVTIGVAGNTQQISTEGTLVHRSPVRLTETFSRACAFGQAVALRGPLMLRRDLLVTLLDDDFFIARDESGVPDIWLRKVLLERLSSESSSAAPAVSIDVAAEVVESVAAVADEKEEAQEKEEVEEKEDVEEKEEVGKKEEAGEKEEVGKKEDATSAQHEEDDTQKE